MAHLHVPMYRDTVGFFSTLIAGLCISGTTEIYYIRIFYLIILNLFHCVLSSLVSVADSHLDIIK